MSLGAGRVDEPESAPEVLIVGAGPAGLFAACELLRHGVRPRIVERRAAPHHETRGTAIQPAVLEILDRGGVIDRFLEAGVHVSQIELMGPGLKQIALTELAGVGCKYEFQCSQPQWLTEGILRERLASLGLEIEFGVEVKGIETAGDGLEVTLDNGGRTEVARPAYLIGAGGAHGPTRHAMLEHLDGETYSGRYIVADVRLGLACPPGRARVAVGRDGFVLFAPLPEGRWLIFVNPEQADEGPDPPAGADLASLVNARVGADIGLNDLRWISYFKMHKRSVPLLSDGRRFLLGDEGHISSPLGGEGINSALMDGADIAWKLALVLRGAAKPSLLDSYAIERGLADDHVLEVSNDTHMFIMQLVAMSADGEPKVEPQDPASSSAGLKRRCMLDVSYAGSPLVGEAGGRTEGPAPGARFPAACRLKGTTHHLVVFGEVSGLEEFRARWEKLARIVDGAGAGFNAAEAGVPNGGAVLVRPDGFVGFRAAPADDAAMKRLDAHLATYLEPNFRADSHQRV
jgi:2-polyprenyl-6-methoxyphenol hydroxylase-like FAD-dependent oxidoreductase